MTLCLMAIEVRTVNNDSLRTASRKPGTWTKLGTTVTLVMTLGPARCVAPYNEERRSKTTADAEVTMSNVTRMNEALAVAAGSTLLDTSSMNIGLKVDPPAEIKLVIGDAAPKTKEHVVTNNGLHRNAIVGDSAAMNPNAATGHGIAAGNMKIPELATTVNCARLNVTVKSPEADLNPNTTTNRKFAWAFMKFGEIAVTAEDALQNVIVRNSVWLVNPGAETPAK